MFLDDFLHGGEAQAGAGPLRRKERLEHLVHMFGGNRRPVVLDQDLDFQMSSCPLVAHGDGQDAARGHGFDRIFENAEEDLLHFGFVGPDRGEEPCILLDHLNAGRFQLCGHHSECVFDHFWNAAEPAREVEWLSEVEDFVENRFDADQVPHRVLDTGLRVEVEDALGRDLFQLCANRAQRFADFSGEKGAELSDGRLPFLFSDHRFRRDQRG